MIEVGFSAARAHRLVAVDRCPILAKSLDRAVDAAWRIAQAVPPMRKPLDIQVTATDAGLDIDVRGSGSLPAPVVTALARLAEEEDIARLTRHGELVAQIRAPTLRVGKAIVHLPPAAFLQATAAAKRSSRSSFSPLARVPRALPTCSPASARSRSASRKLRECSLSTTTKPRWPHSSAPR